MGLSDVADWISEFARPGIVWYAKRLSANDTLATKAHQAGPYIPKEFLFEIFPSLNRPDVENPDIHFDLYIDSRPDHRDIRAVWYNNKFRGGTRNETRLTGFGGIQSALLDPDSTGTLAVFAFTLNDQGIAKDCHVWVCDGDGTEADLFEERLGVVEPKQYVVWKPGTLTPRTDLFTTAPKSSCWLEEDQIPFEWLEKFPTGKDIIRKTLELRPLDGIEPDVRILKRRSCEFEIFRSVEEATYSDRISEGFKSVEEFLGLANTVLQSRKSRSGKSLEYHAIEIFMEEGLVAETDFSHNPTIEGSKKPDFLFPSLERYLDGDFPESRLRMLAAKTTCKDRWRQILNEADRIPDKHLLTLQEGVSENQFSEMTEAGVTLVVPTTLQRAYPESVRPHLMTFAGFLDDIKGLGVP